SNLHSNTPPLLHVLGAFDFLIFGRTGLPYLNIFLFSLLAVGGFYFAARYMSPVVAACALLALITSNLVLHFALAYYQEMLTALVLSMTLIFLYLAYVRPERRFTILAGISLGLLLLAKQTAQAMPVCLMVFWVYLIVRKDWPAVKRFLLLGIIAILVWLPRLIHIAIWTGSPFYPRFSSRVDKHFGSLHGKKWYISPGDLLKGIYARYEIICSILVVATLLYLAYHVFLKNKKKGHGFLLFIVSANIICFFFFGGGAPRHYLQFLPFFCLFGALGFFYLLDKLNLQPLKYIAFIVLAIIGIVTVVNLPNYRERLNCNPIFLDAYKHIREKTPKDALVMSLWTYSTFYHSDRRTTWPDATAPDSPIDLYFEKDPDRFFEICQKKKIDYILVDHDPNRNKYFADKFITVNYPEPFLKCIETLLKQNKASIFYQGRKFRARTPKGIEARWIAVYKIHI
ncbi:unnamed protein product, partial [marine sediment metagenome]